MLCNVRIRCSALCSSGPSRYFHQTAPNARGPAAERAQAGNKQRQGAVWRQLTDDCMRKDGLDAREDGVAVLACIAACSSVTTEMRVPQQQKSFRCVMRRSAVFRHQPMNVRALRPRSCLNSSSTMQWRPRCNGKPPQATAEPNKNQKMPNATAIASTSPHRCELEPAACCVLLLSTHVPRRPRSRHHGRYLSSIASVMHARWPQTLRYHPFR